MGSSSGLSDGHHVRRKLARIFLAQIHKGQADYVAAADRMTFTSPMPLGDVVCAADPKH